jgi:hypothetical protein
MNRRRALSIVAVLAGLALTTRARAEQPADGRQLALRADESNRGYRGQRADAVLTIVEPSGATRTYELVQLWKEGSPGGAGTRTLLRFTAPADIAGTALLTFESPDNVDDRWLYLSNTQQLKRISAAAQNGTILGSDFTYEDLNFAIVDRYTHEVLGPKIVDGRKGTATARIPRFASGYSKTEIVYDDEHGYPLELTFYDLAGVALKTMKLSDYKAYEGKWRAHKVELTNLSSGKKSVYEVKRYQLGLDLSPVLFSPSQLSKR